MKRLLLFFILFFLSFFLGAQTTVKLSFTGRDSAAWVQLDSIRVTNLSQGGDTLLHWPDTMLSFLYVDVGPVPPGESPFGITKYYPNPSDGLTSFFLFMPDKDRVWLSVRDVLGRVVLDNEWMLEPGQHKFQVQLPEEGLYLLTARWRDQCSTIKLLQQGTNVYYSKLEKTGYNPGFGTGNMKAGIAGFSFTPGDTLLMCGYAGGMDKYIQDMPNASKTYLLQFGYNVPCESVPSFNYGGQIYTTVQIGTQCWMAENLNVGTMVISYNTGSSHSELSNNAVIEKYCYNNNPTYCTIYGGLYSWDEAMEYDTTAGTQGICPNGWHIPTDNEWKILEGNTDSQYGVGSPVWNGTGINRGYDAGGNLKENGLSHWATPNLGATNSSGFTGLPGGIRYSYGAFNARSGLGPLWVSSVYSSAYAWYRSLAADEQTVYRYYMTRNSGLYVRCLRN